MVVFFRRPIPIYLSICTPKGVGVGGGYTSFCARDGTLIGSAPHPYTILLKEYLQAYTPHTYPSEALTHDYSDFYTIVKESYQKQYAISKNIEKIFYKRDFHKQKITSKKITKTPSDGEKTGGLLFI